MAAYILFLDGKMSVPWEVIVAVPDWETRHTVSTTLRQLDLDPICVSTVGQCRELLDKGNVRLVFCARNFSDGGYQAILGAARSTKEQPAVVLMCSRTPAEHDEAILLGAFDVIPAPYPPTDVEWAVIRAGRNKPWLGRAGQDHSPTREYPFGKTSQSPA